MALLEGDIACVEALRDLKADLRKRKDVSTERGHLVPTPKLDRICNIYTFEQFSNLTYHPQTFHEELIKQLQNHLYLKTSSALKKVQLFRSGKNTG